jgi:hypothetical protein
MHEMDLECGGALHKADTGRWALKLRRKYATKIWNLIHARCQAAVDGGMTSAGRAIRWPPKTKLYDASRYILDNFPALTRYVDDRIWGTHSVHIVCF